MLHDVLKLFNLIIIFIVTNVCLATFLTLSVNMALGLQVISGYQQNQYSVS